MSITTYIPCDYLDYLNNRSNDLTEYNTATLQTDLLGRDTILIKSLKSLCCGGGGGWRDASVGALMTLRPSRRATIWERRNRELKHKRGGQLSVIRDRKVDNY